MCAVMKSVEPKADLPPANSQTMLTYSALPVRRPYHQSREMPRNMTGVYLSQDAYGLPSNKQQQQRIPPLARPRGMVYQPQMLPGFHRQTTQQQDNTDGRRTKIEGPFPVLDPDHTLETRLTVAMSNNRPIKGKIFVVKHAKPAELSTEQLQAFLHSEASRMRYDKPESRKIGLGPVDSRTDAIRPYFGDDTDELRSDFVSPNIFTHPFQLHSPPPLSHPYCYIPPNLPYAPPLRLHLPPPPHPSKQQHRHDAVVRKRGDAKAFQPMPIKRAKPKMPRHEYHGPSPHVISPRADFQAVTRKSARNRVPASNDGVTHLEDLRSLSSGNSEKTAQEVEVIETMLDSIDLASQESEKSLAGLVECYKKICKGNASSVHNLVSSRTSPNAKHKKRKMATSNGNAPLVIRSFRNPQHPHSVVQYTHPRDQASSPHSSTRPAVPAPYFYSSRGLPQTSDEGGARVRLARLPGASSRTSDAILAAPGAGSISKSAGSRRGGSGFTHKPPEGVEGTRPPSLAHSTKIVDSDEAFLSRENFNVPASTPVASIVDISKMSESETGEQFSSESATPGQRHRNVVTLPRNNTPGSIISSVDVEGATPYVPPNDDANKGSSPTGGDLELTSVTADSMDLETTREETAGSMPGGGELRREPTCMAITISVENEDGTFDTVDLEGGDLEGEKKTTDNGSGEAELSASEVAEKLKESQAQMQAEFSQLLEEHHQIVSHIEELEKETQEEDAPSDGDQETPLDVA